MDYVRPLRRSNGMMISVRDLRKQFGSTAAVDGLSFEVQRGERVDTETARTTALLSTETALSLGSVF